MRVVVGSVGGDVYFSYDTEEEGESRGGICPDANDRRAVAAALEEAREFLVPGLGPTLPKPREAGCDESSGSGE